MGDRIAPRLHESCGSCDVAFLLLKWVWIYTKTTLLLRLMMSYPVAKNWSVERVDFNFTNAPGLSRSVQHKGCSAATQCK